MTRPSTLLSAAILAAVAVLYVYADAPEKVVKGRDARPGEIPYIVALKKNGGHFCGGTLISRKHVLTAAHCVDDAKAPFNEYTVGTGTIFRDDTRNNHKVKNITVHEWFINSPHVSWPNDIALITLSEPINANRYQYPIPLAYSDNFDGQSAVLSGWGRTAVNESSAAFLQTTPMKFVEHDECQKKENQYVFNSMICAYEAKGIGACSGDSGGPLVSRNQLVGVVSWAIPCALGIPDIYTKVSYHRGWVLQRMAENS